MTAPPLDYRRGMTRSAPSTTTADDEDVLGNSGERPPPRQGIDQGAHRRDGPQVRGACPYPLSR